MKNKINKLKIAEELTAEAVSIAVQPMFEKWANEQDIRVNSIFLTIRKQADEERLRLSETQARHMEVIEKFLEIQTAIFKRLEKKLK
jgi:hypothetical protein